MEESTQPPITPAQIAQRAVAAVIVTAPALWLVFLLAVFGTRTLAWSVFLSPSDDLLYAHAFLTTVALMCVAALDDRIQTLWQSCYESVYRLAGRMIRWASPLDARKRQ